MAITIRLSKPETALLNRALSAFEPQDSKENKTYESILTKIQVAELGKPTRGAGLAVPVALDAFKEALGNRLVVPPTPGASWWAMMGAGIKRYGLSRQQCVTIAKTAGAKWRGFIKAESLVRQATVLLAESQLELPATQGGPAEMDDVD